MYAGVNVDFFRIFLAYLKQSINDGNETKLTLHVTGLGRFASLVAVKEHCNHCKLRFALVERFSRDLFKTLVIIKKR